jgi:hypothetical protein
MELAGTDRIAHPRKGCQQGQLLLLASGSTSDPEGQLLYLLADPYADLKQNHIKYI